MIIWPVWWNRFWTNSRRSNGNKLCFTTPWPILSSFWRVFQCWPGPNESISFSQILWPQLPLYRCIVNYCWTILVSGIWYIAFTSKDLKRKDATNYDNTSHYVLLTFFSPVATSFRDLRMKFSYLNSNVLLQFAETTWTFCIVLGSGFWNKVMSLQIEVIRTKLMDVIMNSYVVTVYNLFFYPGLDILPVIWRVFY